MHVMDLLVERERKLGPRIESIQKLHTVGPEDAMTECEQGEHEDEKTACDDPDEEADDPIPRCRLVFHAIRRIAAGRTSIAMGVR
jgi:hypothetical protein